MEPASYTFPTVSLFFKLHANNNGIMEAKMVSLIKNETWQTFNSFQVDAPFLKSSFHKVRKWSTDLNYVNTIFFSNFFRPICYACYHTFPSAPRLYMEVSSALNMTSNTLDVWACHPTKQSQLLQSINRYNFIIVDNYLS